jgi:ADP-ribosylglycohydrolase
MPFETQKYGSEKLNNWDGKTFLPSEYFKLEPGETTDDTGMVLALANSLIEKKEYFPEVAAKHYLKWFKENDVGCGKITKAAMENLDKGIVPQRSGILLFEDQSGNGPAMRIAPLSIFYAAQTIKSKDPDKVLLYNSILNSDCYWDSVITHIHPLNTTYYGAFIYATELYHNLIGFPNSPDLKILNFNYPKNKEVPEKIKIFKDFGLNHVYSDTMDFLAKYNGFGIIDTVNTAIFISKYAGPNFLKAMEMAISIGGDTDTRAALTGALTVAKHGCEVIPVELEYGLKNHQKINEIEEQLWNIHV